MRFWLPLALMMAGASLAQSGDFRMGAGFDAPTTRYGHAILGDNIEYGVLFAELEGKRVHIELPQNRVFEDLMPRLADVAGDHGPEIIVVETDVDKGAQLAVYRAYISELGRDYIEKIAATPHIGRSNRWLAPAGIADFDGDGQNDIAYVDRPHLAKTLRIVTVKGKELVEIASLQGVTNHRIGEDFISGGVRDCGAGPELIMASGDWRNIVALRLEGGEITGRILGDFRGRDSMEAMLTC